MEIKIKNDWQLKQVRSTSTHRSNIEIVTEDSDKKTYVN